MKRGDRVIINCGIHKGKNGIVIDYEGFKPGVCNTMVKIDNIGTGYFAENELLPSDRPISLGNWPGASHRDSARGIKVNFYLNRPVKNTFLGWIIAEPDGEDLKIVCEENPFTEKFYDEIQD